MIIFRCMLPLVNDMVIKTIDSQNGRFSVGVLAGQARHRVGDNFTRASVNALVAADGELNALFDYPLRLCYDRRFGDRRGCWDEVLRWLGGRWELLLFNLDVGEEKVLGVDVVDDEVYAHIVHLHIIMMHGQYDNLPPRRVIPRLVTISLKPLHQRLMVLQ